MLNAYFVCGGWFVVMLPCLVCVIYHPFNIDLIGRLAFVGLSANFRDDSIVCEWVRRFHALKCSCGASIMLTFCYHFGIIQVRNSETFSWLYFLPQCITYLVRSGAWPWAELSA
jgi:hypothetical protein